MTCWYPRVRRPVMMYGISGIASGSLLLSEIEMKSGSVSLRKRPKSPLSRRDLNRFMFQNAHLMESGRAVGGAASWAHVVVPGTDPDGVGARSVTVAQTELQASTDSGSMHILSWQSELRFFRNAPGPEESCPDSWPTAVRTSVLENQVAAAV